MSVAFGKLSDLVIPDGEQYSNVLPVRGIYEDALILMLFGLSTNDADTFTIQVTPAYDLTNPSAAEWYTLRGGSPEANIAPPAAGLAKSFFDLGTVAAIRIYDSTGAAGGAQTWRVTKQWYTGMR